MNTLRFTFTMLGGLLFAFHPITVDAQTTGTPVSTGTTSLGGTNVGSGTTYGGNGSGGNNPADSLATSAPKGAKSSGGSATSIPSSANVFASTYVDYLALGKPSLYSTVSIPLKAPAITSSTFGQPIFGAVGSRAGGGGGGGQTTATATGFSTAGQVRAPSYITGLSTEIPFKVYTAPTLLADARAVIDQSSFINNKERIQVAVEAGIVVLRGEVATEKERRVAETTLRITPGVRDVRNELQVSVRTQ